MKEFLIQNWFVILLAAFAIYLAVTKQWKTLKMYAFELMLQAERIYSDGEGKKKFDDVFNHFYNFVIPPWLRLVFTQHYIRIMLQKWYDKTKEDLSK